MEIKEAITKTNELKRKIKDKQYIQVRKDGTDSSKYISKSIENVYKINRKHCIIE